MSEIVPTAPGSSDIMEIMLPVFRVGEKPDKKLLSDFKTFYNG
jgi:hypothetical protein